MAKITSYSDLNDGTEFTIDLSGSTLALAVAGNLSNDGVTGQAVFSACEDLWKTGSTHNRYRFPFAQAVGELAESLELQGGWTNLNATTLNLIRDTGLRFRSGYGASATVTKEWVGLVQSGTFGLASTQPYVLLDTDTVPNDLNYTGEFNELIQVYDSVGDDDRGSLKIYAREEGYTYGYYDLNTSQEVTTLLPVSYLIPMSTETDTNFTQTYAYIAANTPYTGMSFYTELDGTGFDPWANSTVYTANAVVSDGGRWYITALGGTSSGTGVGDDTGVTDWTAYSGERSIDGTYYAFNKIIDGNSGTKVQIYEYQQYQLRKGNTSDINLHSTNTDRGETALPLLSWEGDTLVTGTGVYVDNVQTAEQSEYEFTDVSGTARTIAFIPTFTINCVDDDGNSTNFDTNTRIQVYDVTNTNELYNNTPGATSTLGVQHTAGGTVTLRYRIRAVNGSTSASKTIQGTAQISTADVSVNIVQESNSIYVDNLVDGSAVSGISIDSNKIDIDISDANNTVSFQEIYAWYQYYLATASGIADSDDLITAATQVDYNVDPTLQVENTKTGFALTITGANVYTTGGAQYDWVDTTGEKIFVLPDTVVNFNSSSGALSAAQEAQLLNASTTSTAINTKLGTPADTDVSTDIANVKSDTAAILIDTADIQPKIGTPVVDLATDISNIGGGSAPTAVEIRQEIDANSTKLDVAVSTRMAEASINTTAGVIDTVNLVNTVTTNTDMRGTDGANTTAPDNAGITQIQSDIAALIDFDPSTDVVEGSTTWLQAMRLVVAEAAGSITDDGAGNIVVKSLDGLKDRITATDDDPGRTVTARDVT